MDPEKKSLNFTFPTKYVIPKSLKFSHWPSKLCGEFWCSSWAQKIWVPKLLASIFHPNGNQKKKRDLQGATPHLNSLISSSFSCASVHHPTWVFPKIGVPQNGWFISWKTLLKWMIWGYHYFWKHPPIFKPKKSFFVYQILGTNRQKFPMVELWYWLFDRDPYNGLL